MGVWRSFDDKESKIKMIIDYKEVADDSEKYRKQNSPKEEVDEF